MYSRTTENPAASATPCTASPMSPTAGRRRPSRRCRRASDASVTSISRGASGSIVAHPGGEGGVAVPAVDDRPAVDRDDVALLEPVRARGCRARSRRWARRRSPPGRRVAVAEEVRAGAAPLDHVAADPVELGGGDARAGSPRGCTSCISATTRPARRIFASSVGGAPHGGSRLRATAALRPARAGRRSRATQAGGDLVGGAEAVDGLSSRPRSSYQAISGAVSRS